MWPPMRRDTVIHNNIILTPPRLPHHHCGGGFGNLWNWTAGFAMAQNMMSGIFSGFRMPTFMPTMPYYSFTGTPYTPAAYGQTGNAMSAARTTLDSLGFTKEAGYSVSMGEDGNLTYTYTNGSETITATNLKELLDKQAAARATTSTNSTGTDDDDDWFIPAGENGGDDTEGVEGTEDNGEADTPDAGSDAGADGNLSGRASNRADRSPQGWYRSEKANSDSYKFTEDELRAHKGADTSVDLIVNQFAKGNPGIDKEELRAELIKKNPSVFDADGNLKEGADASKLDIPTFDTINKNFLKAQSPQTENAVLAKAKVKNNRVSIDYASGNSIYKEGNNDDIMDKDVVLVINGHKYKLLSKGKGEYVDYYQVTNGRPNHFRDFKLIDPNTGRFNPNIEEGLWTDREYFTLWSIDGAQAPLAGAKISRSSEGQVIITKDNKSALMDDVMSKNAPLK